jgi:hypothetical protein
MQFSTGAAVGAGVGGLILMVLLLLGVYFFIRWRKNRQTKPPSIVGNQSDTSLFSKSTPELDATGTSIRGFELHAKSANIWELEDQCRTRSVTDDISLVDDITVAPPKKGQLFGGVFRPPPDKTLLPIELEAIVPRPARTPPFEKFDTFEDNRKYRF